MRKRIEGILLDIDGTLIDSNDAHAKAWQEALLESGFQIDYQIIRDAIGMGGDNLLPVVAKIKKESELGQKIDSRRSEIFHTKYLPQLKPFPSAQQLLEELKKMGMRLVVATSASSQDLKALLKQGNIDHMIDDETNSSDTEHSKPNPDIVEAAVEKSGLSHRAVVMLGDTPYDLEAAKRAGVKAIAFTCGGWGAEDLKEAEYIFAGPQEMLKAIRQDPSILQ